MTEQGEFNLMLLLAIWSLDVGYQNLDLNKQQIDGLMRELTDNQDALLLKIIEQNEEIIRLLKEQKNDKDSKNREEHAERVERC